MRVYLIRHGETVPNRTHVHQTPDTPLSAKGKRQARRVAKVLAPLNIDYIISSDLHRATQTSDIISEALGVCYTKNGLLREIRRPSALYGHSYYHPVTFWYVLSTIFFRNKSGWHFRDGESIREIHTRAREVLHKLAGLSGEYQNVAIVSHAVFLEVLVSFLCKNGETSFFDYLPIFSPLKKMPNGAITTLEYVADTSPWACKWYLLKTNDTRHLA